MIEFLAVQELPDPWLGSGRGIDRAATAAGPVQVGPTGGSLRSSGTSAKDSRQFALMSLISVLLGWAGGSMINWAIVGIGDIARKRVLAALAGVPRSRIGAVVTTRPERAREICAPFGVEKYCAELDEALSDRSVNAVYVATPVFLHASQSCAAMRAGKHVLCEEPTALNFEEATRMVRTAEECGVVSVGCFRNEADAIKSIPKRCT
ncbi:MAG: Gfo/Idh/MocA family oxidoreductase [Rubrivivax sp.]|nr:Gfo/Idh/MocA family oxidoreductase [Rubrivivax sp.]